MRSMRLMLLTAGCLAFAARASAQDLNEEVEKAVKAAAKKASPSVVQIVTQGGADMVVTTAKGPAFRKAMGPTTGVVVSADGYIISSAFNFINNPTSILVALPGRDEPVVAKKVADDTSRMLTLLKVEAANLPVPAFVPKKEIREGQWSIALGRTLDTKRDNPPSVSLGVISALNRIWGKAVQTDAKVSPVNYGGPIVDIVGRFQGILIPASPNGEEVTAGFEWYDSGIGFAIPMEDVMAIVPRLKEGKELRKGQFGVSLKQAEQFSGQPEVTGVAKNSTAEKAGLKAGDQIVEIDGKAIVSMAQLKHALGAKYEGEKIAIKYKRGDKVVPLEGLVLTSAVAGTGIPFLGVLPMRDDPKLGFEIRYVFPKSPAEKAGLKVGDRIMKFGVGEPLIPFTGEKPGRLQFIDFLNGTAPGSEIKLEVKRKEGDKVEKIAITLDSLPGTLTSEEWKLPAEIPEKSSLEKALEPLETANPNIKPAKVDKQEKKVETGLLKRTTGDGEHKYWIFVHEKYDPNVSHGLVVWLHPPGKNKEADFDSLAAAWEEYCTKHNLILVCPASENEDGWIPSEADFVIESIQETIKGHTIDRARIVTHGMGVGGQMALHLAFSNRDLLRGAATVGAALNTVKDATPTPRSAFWLAGGELDPLVKGIAETRNKLAEKKHSALFRNIPNRGREYLEDAQIAELARWIDMLDKQ
ncbi:MAG: PDZ domain-containing protein [Gemmataceae bacterium]|nr:PDZ domain-containing protein [Gemmataceae bacterium]